MDNKTADKKLYKATYYQRNRERLLKKQKAYYHTHKRVRRDRCKRYYWENKEKVLGYMKNYRSTKTIKERVSNYYKEYYARNKEAIDKRNKGNYYKLYGGGKGKEGR